MKKPKMKGKSKMSGQSPHEEPMMKMAGKKGKKGGKKGGMSGRSAQKARIVVGKTYRDADKGNMKGRSQGKSGRSDDPDMELDMAMMKQLKAKKGKGSKKQQNGRSE